MAKIQDWKSLHELSARLLLERTRDDVATWKQRILEGKFVDEKSLRDRLTQ